MIEYLRYKMTFGRIGWYETKSMQLMFEVTGTGTVLANAPTLRNLLASFCGFEICSFGQMESEGFPTIFALEKTTIVHELRRSFYCVGLGMDRKI